MLKWRAKLLWRSCFVWLWHNLKYLTEELILGGGLPALEFCWDLQNRKNSSEELSFMKDMVTLSLIINMMWLLWNLPLLLSSRVMCTVSVFLKHLIFSQRTLPVLSQVGELWRMMVSVSCLPVPCHTCIWEDCCYFYGFFYFGFLRLDVW